MSKNFTDFKERMFIEEYRITFSNWKKGYINTKECENAIDEIFEKYNIEDKELMKHYAEERISRTFIEKNIFGITSIIVWTLSIVVLCLSNLLVLLSIPLCLFALLIGLLGIKSDEKTNISMVGVILSIFILVIDIVLINDIFLEILIIVAK